MTTACWGRNMLLTSAAPCAAMRMPVPAMRAICGEERRKQEGEGDAAEYIAHCEWCVLSVSGVTWQLVIGLAR